MLLIEDTESRGHYNGSESDHRLTTFTNARHIQRVKTALYEPSLVQATYTYMYKKMYITCNCPLVFCQPQTLDYLHCNPYQSYRQLGTRNLWCWISTCVYYFKLFHIYIKYLTIPCKIHRNFKNNLQYQHTCI